MRILFAIILTTLCVEAKIPKIAFLASGPPEDEGFNYMVNYCRILLEQTLSIDTTTLYPNIDDATKSNNVMLEIISEGYDMIFTTSFSHRVPIPTLCKQYPNVTFVQSNGGKPANCSNVAVISWIIWQIYEVDGYCTGLLTKNNKIGYVSPGAALYNSLSENMFYLGAKLANPNVTVYVVSVDTFLDPDRSLGASKILLSHGVDQISQQQDDLTVPMFGMDSGIYGHGTNGYPIENLFGQKILYSIRMNWLPGFLHFTTQFMNGTWDGKSYVASFGNGMYSIGGFSYHVSPDVYAMIMDHVDKVASGNYTAVCGPGVAELSPQGPGGCLTVAQWNGVKKVLTGVVDLGPYHVPLVEDTPSGYVASLVVISTLCLVVILGCMIATLICRSIPVIHYSSPLFMSWICLGGIMICISVYLRTPSTTDDLCISSVFMASLGFTMLFGNIVVKNYRVWKLFNNTTMEQVILKDRRLTFFTVLLLLCNLGILFAWMEAGEVAAGRDYGVGGDKYKYRSTCTQTEDGDSVLYALLVFHGLLVAFGVLTAVKVSNAHLKSFNESKEIAYAIYNIAVCICVALPPIVLITDYVTRIVTISIFMLFSSTAAIVILYLPKFVEILKHGKEAGSLKFGVQSSSAFSSSVQSHTSSSATEL